MSSSVCVEIVAFTASEAYRTDQNVLKPGLEGLASNAGGIQRYQGLQLEEPPSGYIFNVWETIAHHKTFQASAPYSGLKESLKPAFAAPGDMQHVHFVGELGALDKPVTEITFVTLNEGASKERALELFEGIRGEGGPETTFNYGPSVEKEDVIVSICGWESVEDHNAAQKPPQVEELMRLITRDTRHIKLAKVL